MISNEKILSKYKGKDTIQTMFSDYRRIKLEIMINKTFRKISRKNFPYLGIK